ncbi:UDP-N-acetylglucosamine 2-epimerase (non-hydrolyzing) [Jiangella aurantiaca]|uniref:UDP-N-acetylglucosamine 2-epimerase (Non-hydrolyzing) n=1 Tax=Jiangella aurantiaca TaxID=2530373 RepID=A0A4R5AMX9_9ACTN|nr:UDP-N-acetylglucosamine 2-epimerase (non-hydrolyzing) [Jiangella aurantiaca]TDD72986.1 UDP-N-acetylglucosamine 2-epimerase (non-hydrolyzing) [Jiangella aurantiaca]
MQVLSIVGARPQFVKLAPVAEALTAGGHEHVIVHTGQHYDADMSDVFFADLRIPAPDVHLGIGSGSHGTQTGTMLAALDSVLADRRPDWVLVYGDTNSTLAGTLAAVKLHLPVAHLEAGLRSFNRAMPEEHNRVLTDHAADLLLAPTDVAVTNLAREGLAERTVRVGDVMTDVCFRVRDAVRDTAPELPAGFEPGGYVAATIHRAENTDDPKRLTAVVDALAGLPVPVLLLAHPRLVVRCREFGIALERPGSALHTASPLPYPGMVAAVLHSAGVVTDSGGLQKEAYLLGRPCSTLRTETEWLETLHDDWNVLVPEPADLADAVTRPVPSAPQGTPYGDGHAAGQVVDALVRGGPA